MTSLLVADIHQTDNPRESYRWGLFPWLARMAHEHNVGQIIFLGDLTDKKDRHRAELVTRLVAGMAEVAEVCDVYIIPGNHDHIDPQFPFFHFLCGFERIHFFIEPTWCELAIADEPQQCLFLPSEDDPASKWQSIAWAQPRFIFMHQTVIGAMLDNGMPAPRGIPHSMFAHCRKGVEIWSGDIHSPQQVGTNPAVEYVGAPYRVDFGDTYTPRVVLRAKGRQQDLHYPCVNKILIDITGDGEITVPGGTTINPGDHVKVRVTLDRHELTAWPKLRAGVQAWAREGGAVLVGPELRLTSERPRAAAAIPLEQLKREPSSVLQTYSAHEGLDPALAEIGRLIVEHCK